MRELKAALFRDTTMLKEISSILSRAKMVESKAKATMDLKETARAKL